MVVLGLVSFRVFPTHMGGQKGVALFYAHLKNELPVILAVSKDNRDSGGLESHPLLYPNKIMYRNLFCIRALKVLIRSKNIQVVVAEHSYTGWLAWLLHKPFIIHSHNIESGRFRYMHKWWWKLYRAYEGWIHRKADHNFFISEEDRTLAVEEFHVAKARSTVITYGIKEPVLHPDKLLLRKELNLDTYSWIFLFNGTMDYTPNYQAVETLINHIDPLLRQKLEDYRIVITGNRAPKDLIVKMSANENILYLGYVKDIDQYYQAADLFLNPVSNNTGVKTKLIEAIANNCTAVSVTSGASGIRRDLCGDKLVCVTDNDWKQFVSAIVQAMSARADTQAGFYDYYSWKNIAARAAEKINELKLRANKT